MLYRAVTRVIQQFSCIRRCIGAARATLYNTAFAAAGCDTFHWEAAATLRTFATAPHIEAWAREEILSLHVRSSLAPMAAASSGSAHSGGLQWFQSFVARSIQTRGALYKSLYRKLMYTAV